MSTRVCRFMVLSWMALGACASGGVRPDAGGDPSPPAPPSQIEATLVVSPALDAVGPDGWAGVSYALWYVAAAFSADGRHFVSCDPGDGDCRVLDATSGMVIERRAPAGNLDDAPAGIFSDPSIAALAQAEHLVARQAWPAPEVTLTWTSTPSPEDDSLVTAITWTLHDAQRGTRLELARFEAPASELDLPRAITPLPPIASPDGKTLALRALGQVGQRLRVVEQLVPIAPALRSLATLK